MSDDTASTPQPGTPSSPAVTALVALPVLAGALYSSLIVFDHAGEDVYGIPARGVAATIVLLVLTLLGAGVILWSRQAGLSAVVLAAAALGAFGVLAIFSVGLLALLASCALLAWATAHRWSGRRRSQATVGAVLAGAPLPLLVLFAAAGPLVKCEANGSSAGENAFTASRSTGGSSVSSGSATSAPDGTGSGHVKGAGYEYSYECRDGRLVRFDIRRR